MISTCLISCRKKFVKLAQKYQFPTYTKPNFVLVLILHVYKLKFLISKEMYFIDIYSNYLDLAFSKQTALSLILLIYLLEVVTKTSWQGK